MEGCTLKWVGGGGGGREEIRSIAQLFAFRFIDIIRYTTSLQQWRLQLSAPYREERNIQIGNIVTSYRGAGRE